MSELETQVTNYLNYCRNQKRLDEKTLRAYRIDLTSFAELWNQTKYWTLHRKH